MNKKGFILTETLIVSTVVLTSLVLIYTQFAKINISYGDSFLYDNISDIYALGEFVDYLEDECKDSLKDDLTDYIDISDCTSSYYKSQTYCEEMMKATNIKTLIFTNNDILPLYGALSTSNTYSVNLQKYVNTIDDSKEYGYRLVAEFNDGTFASIPFGVRYTPARCFEYEPNETGVTITNYICGDSSSGMYGELAGSHEFYGVRIPSTIDGNPVTIIGSDTFIYRGLTSVIIPDSVKYIEERAFLDNNLESIVIPDNVKTIGSYAFAHNNISELTLGNGVQYIAHGAFYENQLTSVVIPSSVVIIESDIFYNNASLTDIKIDNVPDAISGSPWGATNATVSYLRSPVNINIDSSLSDLVAADMLVSNGTMIKFVSTDPFKTITSVTVDGQVYSGNTYIVPDGTTDINVTAYTYEKSETTAIIETLHNYKNGSSGDIEGIDYWFFDDASATSYTITFDEKSETEVEWDYVEISDETGEILYSLDGTTMAGQTYTVEGSSITILFYSNEIDTYYGFKATITKNK